MAAVTLLGTATFTTASGSKTVTATPAVGDLIVIVAAHSGNATPTAPTDNNSSGTYTLVNSCLKATSADWMGIYVRNSLISSATSTVFTNNPGTTSGGGLAVLKITGMARAGTAAIKQSAKQDNQAAATPAPVFGAAPLTTNPQVGAVFNATSPATMTQRASWTELADVGYSTPTSGLEVMSVDSGQTATTITWGSASGSAFCSVAAEFDSSVMPSVSITVGTFALAGSDANLTKAFRLPAETALVAPSNLAAAQTSDTSLTISFNDYSFTVAGSAATLTKSSGTAYSMTATVGTFALSGSAANTLFGHLVPTTVGTFSLTGNDTALTRQITPLSATVGTFALTGNDINTVRGYVMPTTVGNFALSGSATGLTKQFVVPTTVGTFDLAGSATNFAWTHQLTADVAAFTLTGNTAGLAYSASGNRTMAVTVGTFALAGSDANPTAQRILPAQTVGFTATYIDAALLWKHIMATAAGTYSIAGQAAAFQLQKLISAGAAVFNYTGNDAAMRTTRLVVADSSAYLVTGEDASLLLSSAFTPPVLPLTLTVNNGRGKITVGTGTAPVTVNKGRTLLTVD